MRFNMLNITVIYEILHIYVKYLSGNCKSFVSFAGSSNAFGREDTFFRSEYVSAVMGVINSLY